MLIDTLSIFSLVFALTATLAAFTLSASAGLGGSLILIPSLALVLGTKEAIGVGAMLLAANNLFKLAAYRRHVPVRAVLFLVAVMALGGILGARVMVLAPESWVGAGLIASILVALIVERRRWEECQAVAAPVLAALAGATSGFSGTSGPLKGVALRSLRLDRRDLVGAASLASFATDAAKVGALTGTSLITQGHLLLVLGCLPLMYLGTYSGRRFNLALGERGFSRLFWFVMAGYSVRMIVLLA